MVCRSVSLCTSLLGVICVLQPAKDRDSKDRECETSLSIVAADTSVLHSPFKHTAALQHVCKHRTDDSERTSPKVPAEEPADEDRLDILPRRNCKIENREPKR